MKVWDLRKLIGVYIYTDKTKYQGTYNNGKKNGKGICYFSNGDSYDGMWRNGQMDGKGKKSFL